MLKLTPKPQNNPNNGSVIDQSVVIIGLVDFITFQ